MNTRMFYKTLALGCLSALLGACATTYSVYRSGVQYEGPLAKKDGNGLYQVTLSWSYKVDMVDSCGELGRTAHMAFPIIPMPPIVPLANEVKKDAAERPFTLLINSRAGMKINHGTMKLTIKLDGFEVPVTYSREYVHDKYGVRTYEFTTPVTCGDIRDAVITVENFRVAHEAPVTVMHKANYFAGNKWEVL